MKEEVILDPVCIKILKSVCETSGMTVNQFINNCIRLYGESVKFTLSFVDMFDINDY